jgi:hypothetical protein
MGWYWLLMKAGLLDNNNKIEKLIFDDEWEYRIKIALESSFNSFIPRVPDAGNINKGFQVMHNGLMVSIGTYYGLPITKMLYMNKGVHEPEEEKVFLEVINKMPNDPVMVEMGSFWAFYSMWFLKATTNGKVFMIEPEMKNLKVGERNFKKNKLKASFDNYFIGKVSSREGKTGVICLDDYVHSKGISHIDIAHADIQGFESEMLAGSVKCLESRMIDYFFVSTHTNELHYKCIDLLNSHNYKVVFEVDLTKAASFDGFILAISPSVHWS